MNQPYEFELSSMKEVHPLVHQVRIRDDRANFNERLLAFATFVRVRLGELKLWPSTLPALNLQMTATNVGAPVVTRFDYMVQCTVRTPKLTSRTDEGLIASVGAAADSALATLVPGASLAVLADEFLNAGCCVSLSHRLARKGAAARLKLFHGMRRIDARLEAPGGEYQVFRAPVRDDWTNYFRSMNLSSTRVTIQACSSTVLSLGRAGTGSEARRFVIDLKTNQIVQNWQLTGPRGVPVAGTGFDRVQPPIHRFEGEGGRLIALARPK